ncbi:MAG: GyrI-like domain-containing protein [Victivallaceae bacterium]|nr:GyrI-like domain-containing protein [Victivallaceae bacterium]
MIEITRLSIESFPSRRLIGKRFTNDDRNEQGNFADQWHTWLDEKGCEPLLPLMLPGEAGALLGFMRTDNGMFEYWIGRFCRVDAPVPHGYQMRELPPANVAVAYLCGPQNDRAIYAMHDDVIKYLLSHGYSVADKPFFFERYVLPRFVEPDEKGNIVLDYGVAID